MKAWTRLAAGLAVAASLAACGRSPVPGLPPSSAYVLTGSLVGEDGKPLGYASVALAGSPLGTVADEAGRFALDGLRTGSYGLTVIHLGYRSAQAPVTVPASDERTATLAMTRDERLGPALVEKLGAVTVTFRVSPAGP